LSEPINEEAIAVDVANYVIEHDLIRQPRSAEDLQHLILQILQDRHVKQNHDEIMHRATYIISNDSRVICESKGREEDWAIWVYHKTPDSSKGV
jgi:hypothetical protein